MNKSQFEILAGKMKAGDLKNAVHCVMVDENRQCDAARTFEVRKQSLHQAIKRLKKRAAEFEAMAGAK